MPATIEDINVNISIKITAVPPANLQSLANAIQSAVVTLKASYPTTVVDVNCTVPINAN